MTIEKRTTVTNWEFIERTLVGSRLSLSIRESEKSCLHWLQNFNRPLWVDLVINTGSAGGFGTTLEIGDLVIGTERVL